MKKIQATLTLDSGRNIKAEFAPVERDGFKFVAPLQAMVAGKKFRYVGTADGQAFYREVTNGTESV